MTPELPQDWFVAWHATGGERLEEAIHRRVPALGRERLRAAFAEERISVEGLQELPAHAPRRGARIEVSITPEDAARWRAGSRGGDGFFLLYRDDDLMLADKDSGVLTVPTDEGMKAGLGTSGDRSLVERLAKSLRLPPHSVLPVHRLDRFTTGVLAFARNLKAKDALIQQFARHAITRRYLAITRGVPDPPAGTFRSRLVSDARMKQRIATRHEGGELAITHYEVVQELAGGRFALVVAVLETGKRNQIRVHFAEAGWPLVGEHRYVDEPDRSMPRQALHAAELELVHPHSKMAVSAASPLPADMRRFLGKTGRGLKRPG